MANNFRRSQKSMQGQQYCYDRPILGYNILDKKNERNFVRLKIDHTVTHTLSEMESTPTV